jgi:PEGA domain
MPTDDAPINVRNDADDVTAVRAPPPGLIRKSKMFVPPPAEPAPPVSPASFPKTSTSMSTATRPRTRTPPAPARRTDPAGAWSPSRRTPPAGATPLAVAVSPPRVAAPAAPLPAATVSAPPAAALPAATVSAPAAAARPPAPVSAPAAAAPPPARLRLEPTQPWPSAAPQTPPRTAPDPASGTASRSPAPPALPRVAPFRPPSPPVLVDFPPIGRPAPRSRAGVVTAIVSVLVAAGATGWWQWSVNRPGKVEISTSPPDAVIAVGGERIPGRSPVTLEKPSGSYAVSVTRDGYTPVAQNIEVRAGQVVVLPITLAPVAETGIEIASEPPGVPVWLDGVRLAGDGEPSRAGARTYPVQPGQHLVEIRGNPKFKPWHETVEIEKGSLRSFHVQLALVESAEPSRRMSTGVVTAAARWRAAHATPKTEHSDETVALMAGANPASPVAPAPPASAEAHPMQADDPRAAEPAPAAARDPEALAPVVERSPAAAAPALEAPARTGEPGVPAAGAPVRTVPGRVARALLLIDPNADEYRVRLPPSLARAGMKLSAVVHVCVTAQGAVSEARILKSADPAVDPDIRTVIGTWRYRPLLVDGQATPFCYVLNHDVSPR